MTCSIKTAANFWHNAKLNRKMWYSEEFSENFESVEVGSMKGMDILACFFFFFRFYLGLLREKNGEVSDV